MGWDMVVREAWEHLAVVCWEQRINVSDVC